MKKTNKFSRTKPVSHGRFTLNALPSKAMLADTTTTTDQTSITTISSTHLI